jgi:hypothetical protein
MIVDAFTRTTNKRVFQQIKQNTPGYSTLLIDSVGIVEWLIVVLL